MTDADERAEARRLLAEEIEQSAEADHRIAGLLRRGIALAVTVAALYVLAPQLLDVLSSAERLRTFRWRWFVLMLGLEAVSFACTWWLTRITLPRVGWFVASTSQLVSNAVSRVIPGGAAVGGATLYRMLAVSGVSAGEAGTTLAATSILTTGALFAIPALAALLALAGAPIPEGLAPVAAMGAVFFVLLLVVGIIGTVTDRPLDLVAAGINRVRRAIARRRGRPSDFDNAFFRRERDRMVDAMGSGWRLAMVASAGKWAFDYLALVAGLYGVGADPRLSVVLLAYAGAGVLSMVPITPGGLGFVEAGLTALLTVAGISLQDALLATLAYRLVSFWIPLPVGLVAWFLFRRRYPGNEIRPARSSG